MTYKEKGKEFFDKYRTSLGNEATQELAKIYAERYPDSFSAFIALIDVIKTVNTFPENRTYEDNLDDWECWLGDIVFPEVEKNK